MIVLVLVSLFIAPGYQTAKADPITIIIGVIVAAAATTVVDYMSCGFNIFFYCGSDHGGGGTTDTTDPGVVLVQGKDGRFKPINPSTARDGTECYSTANACGARDNGTVQGGVCDAVTPSDSICCPSTANACGMVNYGAPRATGSNNNHDPNRTRTGFTCSGVVVDPPPNSLCPAPVISNNFYADPARVREGNTTTLYWKDILNATACSLTGGGLSFSNLGLSGNKPTNKITAATSFTLTCINGAGGPQTSQTTQVNLIPSFEEI